MKKEPFIACDTEHQPKGAMDNSQLQLWCYSSPVISCVPLKEEFRDISETSYYKSSIKDADITQGPDNRNFTYGVFSTISKAPVSKRRNDDIDACVIVGDNKVKSTAFMNGISRKPRKLPRLTRITHPYVTPLKVSPSQPQLTNIDLVQQYTKMKEEAADSTTKVNILTTCKDNRKELHFLDTFNPNDDSIIDQQNLQESQIISIYDKGNFMPLEHRNFKFIGNVSPTNFGNINGIDYNNNDGVRHFLEKTHTASDIINFKKEVMTHTSQDDLLNIKSNDLGDSIIFGSIGVKPEIYNNCISLKRKRPPLPPLKRIKYAKPSNNDASAQELVKPREEIGDFTPQGNVLTSSIDSRNEIPTEDIINPYGYPSTYQQKLPQPKIFIKNNESSQLSLEIINVESSSNLSPLNLKRNSNMDIKRHAVVTKLQSSMNKERYFICRSCNNIKNIVNQVNHYFKFISKLLEYCLKCICSIHRIWDQKTHQRIEPFLSKYQSQHKGILLRSLSISPQEIRIIIRGYMMKKCTFNFNAFKLNRKYLRNTKETFINMIKGNSPVTPNSIPYVKVKVNYRISGTMYGYSDSKFKIQTNKEEYQCTRCRYRSKYSHQLKIHINSHYSGQNTCQQKQVVSISKIENPYIYSVNQIYEHETRISPIPILPSKVQMDKKKQITNDFGKDHRIRNTEMEKKVESGESCDIRNELCITTESSELSSAKERQNNTFKKSLMLRNNKNIIFTNINHLKEDTEKLKKTKFSSNYKSNSRFSSKSNKVIIAKDKNRFFISKGHNRKVNINKGLDKISNKYKKQDSTSNELVNKTINYICLECSASFRDPWNYQWHIKRSHKECNECITSKNCAYRSSDIYSEMSIAKPFECSECHYKGTSKGSFMRHMWTHSIEKQLECDICGYRCTGKGQLRRHMWVHKGGGKNLNFWPLSNIY